MVLQSPDVVTLQYGSLLKAAKGQQDDASELDATLFLIEKTLPDDVKALYADPTSKFNFGWSHGVEMLANGQPDKYKGSYYANPLINVPTKDEELMKKYPAYCRPNVWPTDHLPEYEPAFMELGKLICEVGMLVTKVCDQYVANRNPSFQEGRLLESIQQSSCHKGRLLHYFPPQPMQSSGHSTSNGSADANGTGQGKPDKEEDWCGWHTDHGSLTGLTSAMYMKGSKGVPNPDPQAGLYIRQRQGAEVVQAPIPADHIAYQMGEAMQVLSGGLLRATPHYVKAPGAAKTEEVSRETLAIFMQPRWDQVLNLPEGSLPQAKIGVGQWQPGITFGDFAEATINGFYSPKP